MQACVKTFEFRGEGKSKYDKLESNPLQPE